VTWPVNLLREITLGGSSRGGWMAVMLFIEFEAGLVEKVGR
jgi:hypothetical protein